MTEKRISSYVVHKHDIEVNWNASNLVPEKGQFIVYDKEIDSEGNISTLPEGRTEPYTYERFKIGDGIRTVKELPFNNEIYIGDGDMPEGATIQIIMDAVDEEELLKNELTDYIDSEIEKVELSIPEEVYVGDGEMPEGATIQLIIDSEQEEEIIKNKIIEYINTEIARAKTEIRMYYNNGVSNGEW